MCLKQLFLLSTKYGETKNFVGHWPLMPPLSTGLTKSLTLLGPILVWRQLRFPLTMR